MTIITQIQRWEQIAIAVVMPLVAHVLVPFHIGVLISQTEFAEERIGEIPFRTDVSSNSVFIIVESVALHWVYYPFVAIILTHVQLSIVTDSGKCKSSFQLESVEGQNGIKFCRMDAIIVVPLVC